MDYVIGVDIGTQSTKVLLCDARGRIVAQQASGYQPDKPQPLWAEQWPQVWLDAVMSCISGCVRAAATVPGFHSGNVRAICISSLYGGSGIPVDDAMTPLHPCLIWMDRRAADEVEWVRANVDIERMLEITGNGVDSYYGFTKMLWLKNKRPDIWARTRMFLPPNAYVIERLTGVVAIDRSSAGNIGGLYDRNARAWSREMLDALGIPMAMMPERLVASSDVVAPLAATAAAALGLPPGVPVVAGGVDAAMATLAAGVTTAGQHVAMIGSSMCWGFISQDVDARHGLVSMPNVFGDSRDTYVFGGAITAGAAVTWFREQFCREAPGTDANAHDVHDVLDAGAARVAAGADGLLFLPYLMGERSPVWDGKASGAFVGMTLFHQREHLYRAVLEGVSFALRHNIEAGMRSAQPLDDALIVVGGAANSDVWMQIIADVTGRTVMTIAEEVEAPMGAALLGAYAVGLVTAADVRRGWVDVVPRATPSPASVAVYDELFESYKALYPALRISMHDLHDQALRRRGNRADHGNHGNHGNGTGLEAAPPAGD
jgi:sugar (pentulose or hexulose) kinase